MTLNTKTLSGKEYLYFQAGKESIYIGPKDNPQKAKSENVVRALDYARERMEHYADSFDELLPFLSDELLARHASKEITRLNNKITRYRKHVPVNRS